MERERERVFTSPHPTRSGFGTTHNRGGFLGIHWPRISSIGFGSNVSDSSRSVSGSDRRTKESRFWPDASTTVGQEKWRKICLTLHVVLVSVASSYLTLGVFASYRARALWWEYAILIFVLSVIDLGASGKRNGKSRRRD